MPTAARHFRALLTLIVSLLLVALGLPTVASADTTGEISIDSYITNFQGEVPTITAGDGFSYTINVQCSSPDTGKCTGATLTFELPAPLQFADDPFTISPSVATSSLSGNKLTVTFSGGGLTAGQLAAITIKAKLPATASANLDGNTVNAAIRSTADNVDPVSDSVAIKLNIPPVLDASATKTVSPTSTQPALPGRAVTYTLTAANNSNVSVDSLTLAEPADPTTSTPFDTLAITGITSLSAPSGADTVRLSWLDDSATWHDGDDVSIPNDPSTLLPSDPGLIRALRFTFTDSSGHVAAGGPAGKVVVAATTRVGAFDALATGASTTVTDTASTTVRYGASTDVAKASAALTFKKTPIEVTAAKNIIGATLVAGADTIVTATATNGIMPVSTMRLDEPSAGTPDFTAQGVTFKGFVTTGDTDQKVAWPQGATSAQISYTYDDASTDTFTTSTVDTLPAPAEGKAVASFTVTFTGTGDAIVSGAQAVLAFRVTAASVAVEAGVDSTDTIRATVANADAQTATNTASDTVTLLPQRVRASAGKTFSRSSLWAAPGSAMTAELTGAVAGSSTIGSQSLTLTDNSADFWDAFNLRSIVSTDIPSGSSVEVQYFDNTTKTWATLTTQAGPKANWSYTPSNPDQIAGIRFVFSPTDGQLLPPGFNVAPRFQVVLRSDLRSNAGISTDPEQSSDVANTVTTEVTNPLAIVPTVDATASDSVTLRPTGTGGGGAPDLVGKTWQTSTGAVDEAHTDALSGDVSTARITWDTDGLSMSKMVITDDPRGTDGGPVTSSFYDAYDLIAIKPITSSVDPLIGADKVSKVELYGAGQWNDITAQACPSAGSCDGRFPGYTLTDAQRAATTGVRITFEPGSASSTGALAIGSGANPSRAILLDLKLRNTLRSSANSYVLGTSHSYTYNTGTTGVLSNRVDVLGTLTTPTAAGTTTYADTASATMVIYDRPLNISATKSFDQSRLGLPPAGTPQADYPLITATLTATNNTASYVPEITVADPASATSGLGAYDYLNLYQVSAATLPDDLTPADVTVDLSHDTGAGTSTESGVPLSDVQARTPAQLADVVGITVHYGAEANLSDSTKHLIATDGLAKLMLTYQLRATVRSSGAAVSDVDKVTNTATSAIVSPGGIGCTDGSDCDSPTATASDWFGITQPTYGVTSGTSIAPSSRYEEQSASYTVNLAGQPSGTARTKLLTLTDATPTFWNAFDLTTIPTVTVPAPINQLRLSVLTGVSFSYDSTTNTLSYTCGGSADLSSCWHSASWVDAVDGKVSLNLPFGVNATDVRGVRVDARSVVDGTAVQWERPATPTINIAVNTTRRAFLLSDRNGASTTPVPSTRPGMATAPGESVQGTTTNTVTADGTAAWLNQGNTWTATASTTATTQLLHRINKISVAKTPGKSSPTGSIPAYDLDETIPFRLKITNTGDWQMSGLTITDNVGTVETAAGSGEYSSGLVPADVSTVFTYTVDGLAVSGFSAALDTTSGKLTITVPDGFVLAPGSLLQITANLRFRNFLDVGTVVSNDVTVTSGRDFEVCDNTADGIAQTSQTNVSSCSAGTHVRAAASTPMTVSKAVKGVGAGDPAATAGSVNYDDLGVINVGGTDAAGCVSTDGYYSAPCTPITRPGGTERWRLSMTNGGNVAANTVSAIDVLPAVGDTGVTVGTARKSRFSPIFAGNVQVDLPSGGGYSVKTYYATSTATPSCYKSDILSDTSPTPVTDCGLSWTAFSNADFADPTGADAALAAKVKAIKVIVSYADPTQGLAPSGALHVTFDTITPRQSVIADPTTVEPIAWNSAAIGSRTAKVEATENTVEYPARASLITEPRKVGVAIASGRVDLTKTVTVPDGAAWIDALPNSYSGTLVCTADGEPLNLTGTTPGSDASTVSLPVEAKTGAGATVHYNADGSSTLPLFAQCGFAENEAQGAAASSTTVVASNDYATVPNIAHGWSGSAVPNLDVTNAYSFGGFTVAKKVSGPVAQDAAGQAVAFKDFTFSASCTLNGTEVIASAERNFSLRDGQTASFDHLPAGAICSVAETYAAGAASTSASIFAAAVTQGYTDGDDFTLSGDAPDGTHATALSYDNRYTTGAVTITKTVNDATGLWGNADFQARLVCIDEDAIDSTVYDGTVTLSKAQPSVTVADLPTGASCTVSEPASGGANATTITGGTFTVSDDPDSPSAVAITNTFTTGSVKVTKIVQANGAVTTAEPWISGSFPVTLSCTRTVNGAEAPVAIPNGAGRILSKSNNFTTTYTDLPTGATCAATEDASGSVSGQPDPTVTVSDPVAIGNATTAAISVTNNFRAGKLVIAKTLSGVGAQFFTGSTFDVACTLNEATVFTKTGVSVTRPSLASSVLGPIPFGARCDVSETATGGADATPADAIVEINTDDATSDVTTATLDNAFSAGTVTVSKVLTGDAKDAAWATGATFGIAVKCGLTASGPYSYNQTVSVKGGQSVELTGSDGQPLLFPYGTHCWASEPAVNGAVATSIDHDSFATATQVVAAPGAVQNLGITATNEFSYAGFTVTKDVVTTGATDQSSSSLTYNPTFTYTAKCTFNGSTVLNDSFSLSATASSAAGTTSWGSKSYDKLPTGASCTVTETGTGSATSTAITVKRTGKTDATSTGTAATFTLVKGDPANQTGDPAANVAAITNTYQVGSVTITKAITGSGAADWGDQSFAVNLSCTSGFTTATTVYDKTFTFQRGAALSATVDNLPTGASCTVSETKTGGANAVAYTNKTFTVGNKTTTQATVTNTFTEAAVSITKYTRAGTPSSYVDVSSAAPWKATGYDVALTCTRDVDGTPQTINRSDTITGAGTSTSWNMPTGASCTAAETGIDYPANTPTQPDPTTVIDAAITVGTSPATLNVYNYFSTGSLKVTKTLAGEAATAWGGGTSSFSVSCTLDGTSGTVFSAATSAKRSSSGQTTYDSATISTIPVGSVCTVTETNTAGATSTTATVNSDATSADSSARQVVLKPIESGSTRVAAFTNTYLFAGFTVSKAVNVGGATGSDGQPVKYTRTFSYSASCTYNSGDSPTASALSTTFTLTDGATKQLTNLPVGASCSVKETNAQSAVSTSSVVTQNGTAGSTTAGTTSSTFSLVRGTSDANDPAATVAAFTNTYAVGQLKITKAVAGTGAATWGTGNFTIAVSCTGTGITNSTGTSPFFLSSTVLTAGGSWTISNLPTGAICSITETKTAGANSNAVTSSSTATIASNTTVARTVTNTFNTGTVSVTKALKVNGAATTAEPWASATYQMTLSCTKDFNNDGMAETLDLNAVLGSGYATKAITGAGTATWTGLPQGATCGVTEGTITYPEQTPSQPAPSSVTYSGNVSVGNGTTVAETVTNNFDYGTVQITKALSGDGAAAWGGAPYTFDVSCTLAGSTGTVFSSKGITLQRSGSETTVTSPLIGPIPQGAECTATETSQGWATSVAPAKTQSFATIAAGTTSSLTFTNQFDLAGFTVSKAVSSAAQDAAGRPVSFPGSYTFSASCTIGSTEFLTTDQRTFTLTDGTSKTFTGLPAGAACTVTETNTRGASATGATITQGENDPVTTMGTTTVFTLAAGDETATTAAFANVYTTGGLDITKKVTGAGAATWGVGTFTVKAVCTADTDGDSTTPAAEVYNGTASLSADQTWHLRRVLTGATCTISEPNTAGANGSVIDLATPTITTANQPVTVTNTFTIGSIAVTKAITANGTNANSLKPWSTGSYPVTLSCAKDMDGDGTAETLDLDTVLGSGFAAKTITGAGTATWSGLPQGASCTVTEGDTTVTGQGQPTSVSVASATIGNGTTAPLTVTNAYAAGKLVIAKQITGAANTTWGKGPFTFDVACTQTGYGTVYSATGITLTPSAGQTSLSSSQLGPIPFGAECAVTETNSAGATTVTAPDPVTIVTNPDTANVTTATFTNEFDYAGFTVTKDVDSAAKDASGAPISFKAASFTASCTFQGAEALTNAGDRSFTLAAGASKTFTGLPTGASCTVTETDTRGAASTDVRLVTADTDKTTTGTKATTFTLVSGDAGATVATFTNHYTTGSTTISKSAVGSGAELWGTGTYTVQLSCTLANASTTTVYSATHDLAAGESWTVNGLVSGASCVVSEPKTGGANASSISPASFTVGTTTTDVAVTNTFTVGAVKVTKALTLDGTPTTATPWTDGSYTVKLACTRSYNGSTVDVDIPGDSYTAGDARDGVRTITGAGTATFDDLPTGATCAATETDASPQAQATTVSAAVTVGDDPTAPQAITVTNDFHTSTMTIVKQLEGAGQASFGDGPFSFAVACTLPVNGEATTVFTKNLSLQRTQPSDTTLTSAAIGPIPVGASCQVSETDAHGADFTPDPTTIAITETAADNVAGISNQFSAGTIYLSKVLDGAAAEQQWATAATFTVRVVCQADLGSGPQQVFSTDVALKGGQRVNVTDADGQPSRVPLGSHCWANEVDAQGATSSSVDKTDWDNAAVVTAGTPSALQALELTATNTYEYAGFTVTKSVDQGGASDASGAAVEHTATFGYNASCTFNGSTVLDTDFSLARQDGGTWQSRAFSNLPAGAQCTVTETDAAGAPDTSSVVTQNGVAAPGTSGVQASLTLARGTGLFGKDSADINQVAFTNGYGIGSLKVTKAVTGDGAPAWADTSFDISVVCTADLDANADTPASTVFSQTKKLTRGESWQVDKLVAGAECTVEETAWGGATTHPEAQTVSIARDAVTPVTVTNGFELGSVTVSKQFTVDGEKPAGGWTSQLSAASVQVELTCTRDVNGTAIPVTVPGQARRTLSSDNAFATTYSGLPAGAACGVAEVASTPSANATSYSPGPAVVVPAADDAAVTVTNDYHTGTLTIAKSVTGPGAAYGVGPFVFDVSCALPGLDEPVYTDSVSLTAPTLTSSALGPIPVGASCRVTETDAAGATTPAAEAQVSIPDDPGTGNAATATMVNDYQVNQLTVTKAVDNGGAVDASGAPIAYPGQYRFAASCSFQDDPELLSRADQAFTLVDGSSRTIEGLPLGAHCTVTETGAGAASGTTVVVGSGDPVASTSAALTIGTDAGQIGFTNHYLTGAATITKDVTGDGADAWGNAEFTLRARCTLDTDHDDATADAVVFDGTHTVSKASPTWELTNLASGASCTVTEPKTGGANTPAEAQAFTVNADPTHPTAVSMTNDFTTGSVKVQKVITVDQKVSDAEPYASGRYQVKLACAREIDGQTVPIDIPGDAVAVGDDADGVRTITGAGSVVYNGLPTGASCTVAELGSSLALPAAQVTVSQPDAVGTDKAVVATVTNDYHTGRLAITKAFSGDGADAWADTESVFAVDCSLTDSDAVAHPVFSATGITVSRASGLTSDLLGPIPTGAVCTVTETGTGGATVAAAPATVTIADGDDNAVTMTNQFDLGTVNVTTELTLDGTTTTDSPYTGTRISLQLDCRREVNGSWVPIKVPGGADTVITGAGSTSFSGLPIGAQCSLEQTDASLTPQGVSYRPQPVGTSAVGTGSSSVSVSAEPATITAIDNFTTAPLVVEKVLSGPGADDFAVHPFTFAVSCLLDEKGVDEPHLVYTNDAVTLSKASGLTSGELGPIPVGSRCTVTETATGGATVAADPAEITIEAGTSNRAQLTNQFDSGSLVVTKKITVDGEESSAEPYASGVYTMKLACTQQVDGQTVAVAIPGGDTRTITGAGTARFASLPRGAECALSESSSSLAVTPEHVTIDHSSFTVGTEPTTATVTNAFFTSSLIVVANFSGVGKEQFAKPLSVEVNCTLEGAAGSVFAKKLTLEPAPGTSTASSEPLGPIPVGAVCTVTTVSADGADRVPSVVSVTGQANTMVQAEVAATYSAGTVSVVKKLAGWGAVEHHDTTFTFAVTCRASADGPAIAEGKLTITGAGTATLTDRSGQPVLLPAGARCWATETASGGAVRVSVDHSSFASGLGVVADSPQQVQHLTVTVTNWFDPTDDLAYTGAAIGWGLPAVGLLAIGLGVWLTRRRRSEQ